MKKISPQEFAGLLKAPAQNRYKYFINSIIGSFEVWGLSSTAGWKCFSDDDNRICEPFWPLKDFANEMADSEFQPKSIEFARFLHFWLPDIKAKGHSIAVFPNSTMNSIVRDADDLKKDIEYELSLAGYKLILNKTGNPEIAEIEIKGW